MSFDLRALGCALVVSVMAASPVLADDREDVIAAVDGIYAVISGPVGEPRDFDAMREMFLPGAVMGPVGPGPDGQGRGATMDVEGYIERSAPFLVENGFTETATRTEVALYGELAYVRSAYEGLNGATGEVIVTGVNFMTLFKIEGEWKFASLLWRAASEDWPVEAAFED
jgi:hypothetical protein